MIIGTQNHCAAANLANSKGGGTDFSIAAIMARGGSSEPSERSISKSNASCNIFIIIIIFRSHHTIVFLYNFYYVLAICHLCRWPFFAYFQCESSDENFEMRKCCYCVLA
jgi:hypothetical protein